MSTNCLNGFGSVWVPLSRIAVFLRIWTRFCKDYPLMTYADTIAAISTPIGEGALAVVRLSGAAALSVLSRVFRCSAMRENFEPRRVYFGQIHDGAAQIDEVLATFYLCPASYTGEDGVEMSCQGGVM